jgi:hypothetical protein
MKKIILLTITFIILIASVLIFTNKERSYSIDYEKDGYKIVERYDGNFYTFNVSKDNINVDFAFEHKYSNKRKIVDEIKLEEDENDYKVLYLKVFDQTEAVKIKEDNYYSYFYDNNPDYNQTVIKEIDNIKLFEEDYTILIWNSYGFKDIIHNKEYNFIDKEQYDNALTYQFENYLLVPDYNQNKTFNIFYIIDIKNQKINKWKLKYSISFNSYFLGDKDELIYLFDKENSKEYTLDVNKKKIKKISNSNGGIAFEGREVSYSLSDLKYKDIKFKNNNKYNYFVKDNSLYLNYYGSNKNIKLINDLDVKSIISIDYDSNIVWVLSGDSIYMVNEAGIYRKVASYFEWNFSASNKVFMFNE